MKEGFLRWLTGRPPVTVGAWWNDAGLCLVRINDEKSAGLRINVAYGAVTQALQGVPGSVDVGRSNLLNASLDEISARPCQLALAVPSADVFIQTIRVPVKLDDNALEQLSVVEAVSNLPVPPEEICADFIRFESDEKSGQEAVKIAFCRRELIDGLILVAEEAGVSLGQIDRDIQAFHDAVCWLVEESVKQAVAYPIVHLVLGDKPFILVARDALDLLQYPLDLSNADVADQIRACVRRAGMSDLQDMKQLNMIVDRDDSFLNRDFDRELSVHITRLNPFKVLNITDQVPLIALMAALGMGLRTGFE